MGRRVHRSEINGEVAFRCETYGMARAINDKNASKTDRFPTRVSGCPYRKSDPNIFVMEPAENWR